MAPRTTHSADIAIPATARMTRQRRAVMEAIRSGGGSFTAVDVFDRARKLEAGVSLATVYRTIDLLKRTDAVRPLAGSERGEYVCCSPGHHHHLICLQLRLRRGDRALRGARGRGAAPATRLHAQLARAGRLRHLRGLRSRVVPRRGAAWVAVPLAGVTVLSTLAGGLVALRLARDLTTAIALTGGVVVAVALFHVLPEAFDNVGDSQRVGVLAGLGFVGFFLAERGLVLHHRDDTEHARAHASVGALGAAGLSVHSFIDGLGIGLAFGLDTATGVLVFIAVVAHDFADGLNTVSFVLQAVERPAPGDPLARRRRARPAGGRARRHQPERHAGEPRRAAGRSTPASSSTWARPTCSRTRTSTRRGGASA